MSNERTETTGQRPSVQPYDGSVFSDWEFLLNLSGSFRDDEITPACRARLGRIASSLARASGDATRDAQQLYEKLLREKEDWFREAGEADTARLGGKTDDEIAAQLEDMRHLTPAACHWVLNVAAAKLRSPAAATPTPTRDALRWALDYIADGAAEDQTPVHECELVNNPERGECAFHVAYWSARDALENGAPADETPPRALRDQTEFLARYLDGDQTPQCEWENALTERCVLDAGHDGEHQPPSRTSRAGDSRDEIGRLRISLDGVSRDYARCQELFEALRRGTCIEVTTAEELVAIIVSRLQSQKLSPNSHAAIPQQHESPLGRKKADAAVAGASEETAGDPRLKAIRAGIRRADEIVAASRSGETGGDGAPDDEQTHVRQTVLRYAAAARVIHLHLHPFCDESLIPSEMIAEAARQARACIEQLRSTVARLRSAATPKDPTPAASSPVGDQETPRCPTCHAKSSFAGCSDPFHDVSETAGREVNDA